MILKSIDKELNDSFAILSGEIQLEECNRTEYVFFRYPKEYYDFMPVCADPFFPCLLIPAMQSEKRLRIVPAISDKLLYNSELIQDIFSTWHRGLFNKIPVEVSEKISNYDNAGYENGTFFSLGVDSIYTMLKYLPYNTPSIDKTLNYLIYMKGIELPLSIYTKGQDLSVIESINSVASHYNLKVITGETNLRDVFPLDWADYYFGPGLASCALSLSQGLGKVYIPSSHSYATLLPDPSSPLIDHNWSTERINIYHDGGEKERVRKISDLIAHYQFALDNLRVCVENDGGIENCGKCWKCIRTMITLEIIDKLKDSKSFPNALPKHFSKDLKTYIIDSMEFTKENYRLAKEYNRYDLANKMEREIRIGNFDHIRNGKSSSFIIKEIIHFLFVKFFRHFGFFK